MNYDILGVKLPIRLLKIYTELFLQNRFDKRNIFDEFETS